MDAAERTKPTTTRWGRARFGRRARPAMALAIPAGLALAIIAGASIAVLAPRGSSPWLVGVVFAFCLSAPMILLIYVIIVDRSTMTGAATRPEDSVESGWYDRAAAGSQSDVILACALAAVAFTLFPTALPTNLVLAAVIFVAFATFGVRYLVLQRRG